jgi:hypothetical protein
MDMKAIFLLLFASTVALFEAHGQTKRALIVNGDDGDLEPNQVSRILELLENEGYQVAYLTGPEAIWQNVKTQAQGVNIFIYSGHGSNQGYHDTGGICLNERGGIVSSYTLESEIQLARGALVVFKSVCGGAGSSASDRHDIGLYYARQRVSSYAQPFFKMGASAYYADNYSGGIENFLRVMLEGQTLQNAYQQIATKWNQIEPEVPMPGHPAMLVGVSSNYTPGKHTVITTTNGVTKETVVTNYRSYDVAYAGNPNFKLR